MMSIEQMRDLVDRLSEEDFGLLKMAIREREGPPKPSELIRMPREERERILAEQAREAARYYDPAEWADWQAGDFYGFD